MDVVVDGSTTSMSEDDSRESRWKMSLRLGETHGAAMSVWGSRTDRIHVVGGQLQRPSTGFLFVGDGRTWEEVDLGDVPMLHWVWGVGDEVFMVGREGTVLFGSAQTGFVRESAPTDRTLWGVWGSSLQDVWAVGGEGVDDEPVLLHRTDGEWRAAALPEEALDSEGLFKVWGSSADDVSVVGQGGLLMHFDGEVWEVADGGDADLISVWGAGAVRIAVGGRSDGVLMRAEGDGWRREVLGSPGLNGVWVDASGEATCVGSEGWVGRLRPGDRVPTPEESTTRLTLHAVYGFEEGLRIAVGGSLLRPPPYVGLVLID